MKVFKLSEDKNAIFSHMMDVLGNPVRRRIIQKLSEGPDYPLRLSGELNIGQQLASKHLKIITDAGLVDISWEKSSRGAKKKMYTLNKHYSLRLDFAPHVYNEELISFDNPQEWIEDSSELEAFEHSLNALIKEAPSIDKLNPVTLLLSEIDLELESIERKRAKLLNLRNLAMKETSSSLEVIDRHERRVIHHIINKGPTTVENLSRHLQLREEIIRKLLIELKEKKLVKEKNMEVSLNK